MTRGYRSEQVDETVSLQGVYVKHATEKALLCVINGAEHWIPKSQIDDASEVFDDLSNDEGTLVISQWLASQKGFD